MVSEEAELAAARDAVLDTVRTSLDRGGLPLGPLGVHAPPSAGKSPAYVWRSRQPWHGPLAQAAERALLFVAVGVVERIAGSRAWASAYLDDHRIRLDLVRELDEIDDQGYRMASLRQRVGDHAALEHGWQALVDRVAALSLYANRLLALEAEIARQAAADRAAVAELHSATLATGAARDELAADHLRALAGELHDRAELTNSETSHRNGT